jgi:hypothetical protein
MTLRQSLDFRSNVTYGLFASFSELAPGMVRPTRRN